MDFIVNVLAAIVVLGVMIIFHELGHFLAAKYFNVRVEAFSIGFGKRIVGTQYGDTDYRICALPLGGYVKMAGDNMGEGTGDPGEFLSKPRWQRFIIAFMGPAFNFILAVLLLTALYMYRYQKPAYWEEPAELGVVQDRSPAQRAGLRAGDVITKFDGVDNPDWEQVEIRTASSPGLPVEVSYRRDGKVSTTTVTPEPEGKEKIGVAGWYAKIPSALVITAVEPGEPADRAGVKVGDVVVSLNDQPILNGEQFMSIMQQSKDAPVTLKLKRGGQEIDTHLAARYRDDGEGGMRWRAGLGILTRYDHVKMINTRLNFRNAVKASIKQNRFNAMLIFDFVGKLLERRMSPKSMAGPIGIGKEAGDAVRLGLTPFITLMAFISVNLGIFNLFPIPILDGGAILLLLIEGAMRRDLSVAVKEKIITVGFVFLVMFAVYVTYQDIVKRLPARFERFLP